MSLKVPEQLAEKAQHGNISDDEFIACVRESLPYAWSVVEGLIERHEHEGAAFVDDGSVPPDDKAWGELLRFAASDSMRAAVERRYGVRLAFQNCCRLAAFSPGARAEYKEFVSARAQVLNQNPALVNC